MTATKNSRFRRRRQVPRWGDVLAPLLDVIFLLVIFYFAIQFLIGFEDLRQMFGVYRPEKSVSGL